MSKAALLAEFAIWTEEFVRFAPASVLGDTNATIRDVDAQITEARHPHQIAEVRSRIASERARLWIDESKRHPSLLGEATVVLHAIRKTHPEEVEIEAELALRDSRERDYDWLLDEELALLRKSDLVAKLDESGEAQAIRDVIEDAAAEVRPLVQQLRESNRRLMTRLG